MRKTASILMAMMVLLTGIHLSIASHSCQGKLVNVKVSITSEKSSSCCMDISGPASPSGKIAKKHCCDNGLTTLTVDSNYSPSFSKSISVAQKIIHNSDLPITGFIKALTFIQNVNPILSPPGIFRTNTVELADICVFRI